jgi:hypothetical protein
MTRFGQIVRAVFTDEGTYPETWNGSAWERGGSSRPSSTGGFFPAPTARAGHPLRSGHRASTDHRPPWLAAGVTLSVCVPTTVEVIVQLPFRRGADVACRWSCRSCWSATVHLQSQAVHLVPGSRSVPILTDKPGRSSPKRKWALLLGIGLLVLTLMSILALSMERGCAIWLPTGRALVFGGSWNLPGHQRVPLGLSRTTDISLGCETLWFRLGGFLYTMEHRDDVKTGQKSQ